MKSILLIFLLMGLPSLAIAGKISSTIHSIDIGKSDEPHLVRFDNGRVSFLDADKTDLLEALLESSERKELIEVDSDLKNHISGVQTLASAEGLAEETDGWNPNAKPYRPAVVENYNAALKIFNKMRLDYTANGECYNRAHIWSYEEFKKTRLNSMKVFMFFTQSYIRKYKFHWWFHVTPMVYVSNFKSPRTLDRRYTSGPRQTKIWSDAFVRSKRLCKKVSKFDDFWLNQKSEDCYHIYASMYYVVPRDLEKRDITRKEKTKFVDREIQRAYENAFK